MKLSQGLAAIVLMTSAAVASAEVTGTVTVTSDYDFRGISQTAKDPALQGSIDWSGASGFYAGIWASNVDFGDCCDENIEVDYYAGFAGGEDLAWDVGIVYYSYPGADSIDFGELYASLGYKWIEGKIWYSNDFGNSGDSAEYYEANVNYDVLENLNAFAHVGYSDGDYWSGSEYTDWSVGVTYSLGNFDLGLKYVDGSDLNDLDDYCKGLSSSEYPECKDRDVGSTDPRVILSISTTFPWE
jgi:uncharacterized protein (TIGR02001 family)